MPIVGDVQNVLTDMLALLEAGQGKARCASAEAWWTQIELWRSKNCLKYDRNSPIIKPQYVVEKL